MAVPKTSVHLNNGPVPRKYQVGAPRQSVCMQPVSQSSSKQPLPNCQLRARVFALDTSHHTTSSFFIYLIIPMAETIECGAEQLGADYTKKKTTKSIGFFFRITKWILQGPAT